MVAGDGPFAGRKPGKNFDMNNLRLGNISPEGKHVTLYFDPPKKGKFFLKLKKKGEQNGMTEILKFDNKKNKEIEIAKKTRTKIDLIMSEDISNFVLEGELNEIKD